MRAHAATGRSIRIAALLLAGQVLAAAAAHAGVESTVHNLSASGPGTARAPEVTNVCIFCHTPHDASPTRGLWNHELPAVTYRPYESTTLEAEVDQPTGASRLCLSCHDGTLALGAIRKLEGGARPALGPLTGAAVLGTDLSDDHPVSFVYDAQLAVRVPELADPTLLPHGVRLDETGQLQCTSCHDPHEDRRPKFLVLEQRFGELCLACHRLRDWPSSAHATSAATWNGAGTNPWPEDGFTTVAENACDGCHRPHAAGHPERLLTAAREEDVCFACHGGTVAQADLRREFRKPSVHPIDATTDVHQPREDPLTMPRHVECADCHEPHRARASGAARGAPPALPGAVEGVSGVTAAGGPTSRASVEYEVCFKCHGLTEQPSPFLTRADNVTNTRLELASSNASYHPVVAIGRNPALAGFEPGYTASSMIGCTDCHDGDDSPRGGGTGAAGPHGSQYEPILAREYQLEGAPIGESFATYRLCYGCHNRAVVLSDAQPFPHRQHLSGADGASCAVCHDAHGSRTNRALVNFMVIDRAGQAVVTPSSGGRLEFQALGAGSGRCFLTCHGVDHAPKEYGLAMETQRALRRTAPLRAPRPLLR